ncbi:MAG: Rpn family recombination-promoting nuclease/putative transposase [Cyanobacteriota bacterium]
MFTTFFVFWRCLIYFVEVQFQKDPKLYSRLFSEIFLYLHQSALTKDWCAVVVYPRRSLEPTEIVPYRTLLASEQVQRVYLDELGEAADESLGIGIVQLVVERKARTLNKARRLLEQARQGIEDENSRQKFIELIETILLYKFTKLSREELAQMLGIDDEFRQTRMYQSIKQEGKLEGKLESVPQLLALGLSIEQVAQGLGLTIEQVQQAAQKHQEN